MAGKYLVYPEYKESGSEWVGCVPAHWLVSKLKYYANQIVDGAHFTPTYVDEGVPFLRVTDIQSKLIDRNNIKFIPQSEHDELINRCKPKQGDLLLSKNGTIGIPKIIDWDWEFSIFVSLCLIKLKPILDVRFVSYFFMSHEIKEQIYGQIKQSTVINLHLDKIENFELALPLLGEQSKIANFLDHETAKIDTLIEKQQQLIKLLKEKRQAVISHAVTKGLNPNVPMRDSGVEWLGEVPEHWELPKLIHRTSRVGDGLHSTPNYQDNTGHYFVNGNNLINGQISIGSTAKEVPEEEYRTHYIHLDEFSVLLSINGTIGNIARYNGEKIILGKSAAYINCSCDLSPEYLMLYLQSSQALRYFGLEMTGTTIFNLSLNSIRQMKICIPSKIEQVSIDNYCQFQKDKYDALINKANSVIALMQERRTALISAAVTGKIDVRNFTPANEQSQAPSNTATNKTKAITA